MEAIEHCVFAFNLPSDAGWILLALDTTFYCWADHEFCCDVLDFFHCPFQAECDVINESICLFKIFNVLWIWMMRRRDMLGLKTKMYIILAIVIFISEVLIIGKTISGRKLHWLMNKKIFPHLRLPVAYTHQAATLWYLLDIGINICKIWLHTYKHVLIGKL